MIYDPKRVVIWNIRSPRHKPRFVEFARWIGSRGQSGPTGLFARCIHQMHLGGDSYVVVHPEILVPRLGKAPADMDLEEENQSGKADAGGTSISNVAFLVF